MAKKILIIEDEEIINELLAKKLTREGYEVFITRNGNEGMAAIKKEKPDLILLDIVMPEMDGFEVMEQIQKNEDIKNIPIIIISNSGQPVELEKAKKLGARDWLIKTEFDPQEVVDKIAKQIGK
jgi:CheY-like chemotaxis protein